MKSLPRRLPRAVALAWLCGWSVGPAAALRLSVVVDGRKPAAQKVIAALERDLGRANVIEIHDIRGVDLSDPLAKGRFLARIAAADLVVPIGDPASRLVSVELEELRTFFIAAGGLAGGYLSQRQVAGILSYSPEETVRVAKTLLPLIKDIGVLYTPGYEAVSIRLQSAAEAEGLTMTSYRVGSRREVGPAIREAAVRSGLVWIVGDPLLTQDLIFTYILQESLRHKKPLAAPLPELVEKGGIFCTVPDDDSLARLASVSLARVLAGGSPEEESRVQPAPAGGFVLVNRRLTGKWGIHVPRSLRLWDERGR